MMRSGLDKPGALPLLALIIFSLLTLVPSLSSIYSLKFADLAYYTGGARRVPLIHESVAEIPPDTHHPEARKSWIQTAPYRPRGHLYYRSSRIENGAPSISTEAAAVDNRSGLPHAATESSTFSRRARALRAYFSQQIDDYQFLAPFSNRSLPADSDLHSHSTSPNRPLPTSVEDIASDSTHANGRSESTSSPGSSQCPSSRSMIWQQACRSALDLWRITKQLPYPATIQHAIQYGSQSLANVFVPNNTLSQPSDISTGNSKEPSATGNHQSSTPPTPKDKAQALPGDKATDAAGRHSPQLQGSCMAVVIGLVAGIMWF